MMSENVPPHHLCSPSRGQWSVTLEGKIMTVLRTENTGCVFPKPTMLLSWVLGCSTLVVFELWTFLVFLPFPSCLEHFHMQLTKEPSASNDHLLIYQYLEGIFTKRFLHVTFPIDLPPSIPYTMGFPPWLPSFQSLSAPPGRLNSTCLAPKSSKRIWGPG